MILNVNQYGCENNVNKIREVLLHPFDTPFVYIFKCNHFYSFVLCSMLILGVQCTSNPKMRSSVEIAGWLAGWMAKVCLYLRLSFNNDLFDPSD